MAEEQLELNNSLARAKEEERICKQMNNEEMVSTPTCLLTQRLPVFPVCSPLPDSILKNANFISLSTVGSVVTMSASVLVTSSRLSNAISVLKPAMKSLPVSSSGSHISGHQKPSQADPLSGYGDQTTPISSSPMTTSRSRYATFDLESHVDTVSSGCVANPIGNPLGAHTSLSQSHFVNEPAAVFPNRDQLPGNLHHIVFIAL